MKASTGKWFDQGAFFTKLSFVSVLMTIGNKFLMLNYTYPNVLMLFQTVVAVLFISVGIKLGSIKIEPITMKHMQTFALPTVAKFGQMYTSLQAFPYVAVATVVVFRNLSTCAIAFLDGVIMGEPLSKKQWLSVILMLVGVGIYSYEDINFDPVGYTWLLLNSVIFVFNTMYNRNFISKTSQSSDGINLIQQASMVPLILVWAISTGEVRPMELGVPIFQLLNKGGMTKTILLGTCLGGCVIGSVYAEGYKKFSATTVTIAANVIKFLSVFVGVYVFGTKLSLSQMFGLLVSIGSGLWYSLLPKLPKTQLPTTSKE